MRYTGGFLLDLYQACVRLEIFLLNLNRRALTDEGDDDDDDDLRHITTKSCYI